MRKALPWIVIIAAVAGAFAIFYWTQPASVQLSSGTLLPHPRAIEEFRLIDHRGQPFSRDVLKGQWTVLFLGFTHCPDICPTTLSLLTAVDSGLDAKGIELGTVFLSADPERDTPQKMAQYLSHFNPQFIGLTGEKAQIDKLCANLSLGYVKNPDSDGNYTVDHSTALVLIDNEARVAAYFQPPHDVIRLTTDLAAVIQSKQ